MEISADLLSRQPRLIARGSPRGQYIFVALLVGLMQLQELPSSSESPVLGPSMSTCGYSQKMPFIHWHWMTHKC